MRSTPVIVFINKLDRPSKEPFDLLDEVEKELRIRVRPAEPSPFRNGAHVPRASTTSTEKNLSLFTSDEKLTADAQDRRDFRPRRPPELDSYIGAKFGRHSCARTSSWSKVSTTSSTARPTSRGELAPVFFGSAVNNFGVRETARMLRPTSPPRRARRPPTTRTRGARRAEDARASCSRSTPTWIPTTATASPS